MKQEILNKIGELQNQIGRLEQELKGYINNEEASEPIQYNIDKRKWEIEELVKPIKEQLKEAEEKTNNEIEKLTKEANQRIQRLEQELKGYIHDEEASEPIQYNIDKIKWELEEKIKNINNEYEMQKNNILAEIEKTGINLEEYGFVDEKEEKDEKEEIKDNDNKEEINSSKLEVDISQGKQNTSTIVDSDRIKTKSSTKKDQNIKPILTTVKEKDIVESEEIEQDIEETKDLSNEAVRIMYSARYDKYIVRNINTGEDRIVERNSIEEIDKEELAQKLGKNLEDVINIDVNIFQLLMDYDKINGTTKSSEYFNMMTSIGKTKKDIQKEMRNSQIDIEYNLKGLYDTKEIESYDDEYEDLYTSEERRELLNSANIAKRKGIATVKKGFKVTIREQWDNITTKLKNVKWLQSISQVLKLPEAKEEQLEQQEQQEQEEIEQIEGKGNYFDELIRRGEKFRKSQKISEEEMMARDEKKKKLENQVEARKQANETAKSFENGAVWKNGNIVPKIKDDEIER